MEWQTHYSFVNFDLVSDLVQNIAQWEYIIIEATSPPIVQCHREHLLIIEQHMLLSIKFLTPHFYQVNQDF